MALNHNQLIYWGGEIGRRDYLIWGAILFAVKLNLDRLTASLMGRSWDITSYYTQVDHVALSTLTEADQIFFGVMILTSIPFIWVGTLLCLKRLRDAKFPNWMLFLFFLPFINLLMFLLLTAIPRRDERANPSTFITSGLLPKSKFGSAVFAVSLTCLFSLLLFALFISILGDYGWSVFIGIPFFLGFTTVVIYGSSHPDLRQSEAFGVACLSVLVLNILMLVLAFEGIICVIIGLPILIGIGGIGAALGYSVVRRRATRALHMILIPLLAIPAMGFMENSASLAPPLIAVSTEVEINASKQDVWNELVAFSQIDEPTEWLFKTGIAYPTHAEIAGRGVGAVRHCHFTTGSFIEPITVWNEPHTLSFSVLDQPAPMVEWSLYQSLDIPHLDGSFQSERGEFQLETLSDGRTRLRGTTWYRHDIWPGIYWRLWSDFILHRIHLRVLNHIGKEAEKR